jgi:hypothetical protein
MISGKAVRKLPLLLFMLPLFGCGTTTIVGYDGPCPSRPELEPISVELQIEIAPHTLMIIAENQLKLKKHIKDLEALSGCKVAG